MRKELQNCFGKSEDVIFGRQACGCGGIPFCSGLSCSPQNMAIRTLGFAFKIVDDAEASDCVSLVAENDLSFLGVVAISDPIRPDVPAAIAKCQSAGIR